MPKGLHGEKRPADAVSRAIIVAKIATGEIEGDVEIKSAAANGRRGGKARVARISAERRAEIARNAAKCRSNS